MSMNMYVYHDRLSHYELSLNCVWAKNIHDFGTMVQLQHEEICCRFRLNLNLVLNLVLQCTRSEDICGKLQSEGLVLRTGRYFWYELERIKLQCNSLRRWSDQTAARARRRAAW